MKQPTKDFSKFSISENAHRKTGNFSRRHLAEAQINSWKFNDMLYTGGQTGLSQMGL